MVVNRVFAYLGAGDADRHPEADTQRQGREYQEAPGDAPEQGRRLVTESDTLRKIEINQS